MWINSTSPARERIKLINQYVDLENNLIELVQDLTKKKPTPGNLLLIETALEGKFCLSSTMAINPQDELIAQLQTLNYPDLANKAMNGDYTHSQCPRKIFENEISFLGRKMGPS